MWKTGTTHCGKGYCTRSEEHTLDPMNKQIGHQGTKH